MLCYNKIKSRPSLIRSLTGLSAEAFQKLVPAFERGYETALVEAEQQRPRPRQRQRGGGRKATLETIEDKLLFILCYFKFYPVQILQGLLFGLGQPQANEWIHRLTPVLNEALGYEMHLPARQTTNLVELLAACPELEFLIDGTERPIQRPKDRQKQGDYYSGKKKRHTLKNNIITHKPTKKIKGLSRTVPGKKHDKKLADDEDHRFPAGSHLWQDTGFQGYRPEGVVIHQPQKKPKGGELTLAQKEQNQLLSRQRIGVEHAIGGLKVYHIVRDIYRNHKQNFDDLIMETACGLFNLRLDFVKAA